MKTIFTITAVLLTGMVAVWSGSAAGWASANRAGGSTQHSYGSTSHENRYGGSSTHEAGEGTEHTNAYGGSTAHAEGGGTEHTNVYGGTTAGAYGAGAVHTTPYGATAYHPPGAYPAAYYPYHPPTAVPYYSSGCYGCAAAAGAVVGAAAGAAVASANTAAATSNAYAAGVATGSANTAAATSAAYGAVPPVRPWPARLQTMRWASITRRCPPARWRSTRTARPTISTGTPGSSRRTARTACITTWCPRPEILRGDSPRAGCARRPDALSCESRPASTQWSGGRDADVIPTMIDAGPFRSARRPASSANGETP